MPEELIIDITQSAPSHGTELDPRVVTLGIEVNGVIKKYTGLQISARGIKYANQNQNEAEVTIENLDNATLNYILTETSPFNLNLTPKRLFLYAGRQSYGTSLIYAGNIITSTVSQPPDIRLSMKCLTGNFHKGNIFAISYNSNVTLSQAAAAIADNLTLGLDFQANDKSISNYSYSGNAYGQLEYLAALGLIDVFIDDNILVVKNSTVPLARSVKLVDVDNGMIGIPILTEHGVTVRFLVDNETRVGGLIGLRSIRYPVVNGNYIIYKLGFEITSRDTPFYYIVECKRFGQ
jgi:hypothetical protein